MSSRKSVLVIEDTGQSRDLIRVELQSEYDVSAPEGQTPQQFYDYIGTNHRHAKFDFLILDMDFAGMPFGGIVLHNRLVRSNLVVWKNLIIASEHITRQMVEDDFQSHAWSGNELGYKVFVDTINLPMRHYLNGRMDHWLNRLHNVLAEFEGA